MRVAVILHAMGRTALTGSWTTPDAVNALVAVVALGLGLLAVWRDKAQHRELVELQRRLDTRDAGRRQEELRAAKSAKVTARIQRRPSARPELLLQNVGASRADRVRLFVDGKPAHESEHVLLSHEEKETVDFGPIDAGGSRALPLYFHMGTPRELRVRVEWADGNGIDAWESALAR